MCACASLENGRERKASREKGGRPRNEERTSERENGRCRMDVTSLAIASNSGIQSSENIFFMRTRKKIQILLRISEFIITTYS